MLVILTPGFPPNEHADTCLPFLQNLVKAINRNFPAVTLIIVTFQYPAVATEYFWNNNRVIAMGGCSAGKIGRCFLWLKVWRTLTGLRQSGRIKGLLNIWLGECALLGRQFGELYRIPHKTWVVGQDARQGNKYISKMRPDDSDLIAISDAVAKELVTNYSLAPRSVIPNGIDPNQFQEGPIGRPIDILGAGSLIVLKQYQIFIEIVRDISEKFPCIASCIAGDGPEKAALQHQIVELQLAKNISLPGEIDHGSLLALMQRSKIFLHPSRYEGFSMACLEALYAGCHVISFCQPMEQNIARWHVVTTKEAMSAKVREILDCPRLDHQSVFPYSVDESAKAIFQLFCSSFSGANQ